MWATIVFRIALGLVGAAALQAEPQDSVDIEVVPVDVVETESVSTPPTTARVADDTLGEPNGVEQWLLMGDAPMPPSADFTDRLVHHLPDPVLAVQEAHERLQETKLQMDRAPIEQFIRRVQLIQRPVQVRLSLEDVIQRTLAHNYGIQVESYNPAIETTRVVEAEAAFDAAFFMNVSNDKVDQPTASAIQGSQIQTFVAQSGIRKLMPSGMQVETSLDLQRSSNNFAFQEINPVWTSSFSTTFRQPLLRGFGLDVNRAQIRVNKINRRRMTQQYKRSIRDNLRDVEEAYWRLVQARRSMVISARLLASFETIYNYLYQRKEFDVYRIQLADTRARLEGSKADFIQLVANVRNAEDQLIGLMNDPELDLADDIEIIPTDVPVFQPIVLDRLAEVTTALEHRQELHEAKLAIDSARIQVGAAKNQALPQLDMTFRYVVEGLGESADDAFDIVTRNDFHEYFVSFEFELPVGNRARRAALRRANLQHAQAIAQLKQAFESVILDVNVAVREVLVNYDQIGPSLQSAEASEDQVESIIARAEKKDFLTLNNELNTRQTLAQAQNTLLQALVDYSIAIIDLERSKGTLLRYNNIDLEFDDDAVIE